MRKIFIVAAGLVAITASTNARAMTCDEFLAGVQAADKEDFLPDFEVVPQEGTPEGYLEIANLKSIETGLVCKNGELDTFGGSLINTQPADLVRWSALVMASVSAVSPSSKNPARIARTAVKNARAAAAKNEIRTGVPSGASETTIGRFTLTVTFTSPDGFQFDISPSE